MRWPGGDKKPQLTRGCEARRKVRGDVTTHAVLLDLDLQVGEGCLELPHQGMVIRMVVQPGLRIAGRQGVSEAENAQWSLGHGALGSTAE